MTYYSDIETDRRLAELEKKIAKEYRAANKDLTRTAQEYFEKFEKRYKKEYAAYQDGKYTKAQFDAWVKAQVMRGEHWQHLRDQAAERLTHTNTIAAAYINSDMPSIWTLNFNYEGYRAEQELRGISFDIADEWTVRRLMTEEPDLLPTLPPEKAINIPKDQLWNRRKITQSVNAAIIRGQGVSELAKSFEHVVGMNRTSAIRNARTAYTGAQNGGRQQSYEALAAMGVDVEKQWIATLDGATRPSHMRLDGETVPYKDTFSNGLEYPGDPAGSPAEVYNCRCTMKAILDGNRNATRTRRARDENGENKIVENMTYAGQGRTVSYQRWIDHKNEKMMQSYVDSAECITTPKKYTEYFLKGGTSHSREFFDVGYSAKDDLILRYDMAKQFNISKGVEKRITEDGADEMNIYMQLGITKARTFRTSWRKDAGTDRYRIITAYRFKVKKK